MSLKNFNRLIIFSLFVLVFINSGFSVTYLNSCGETILSNNDYYLNFTETSDTTCFTVGSLYNVTITGKGKLNINHNSNFIFFKISETSSRVLDNITFNNITIDRNSASTTYFFYLYKGTSQNSLTARHINFNNVNLINHRQDYPSYFIYLNLFYNNILENVYVKNSYFENYYIYLYSRYNCGQPYFNDINFQNVIINNYLRTDDKPFFFLFDDSHETGICYPYSNNLYLKSSVILLNNYNNLITLQNNNLAQLNNIGNTYIIDNSLIHNIKSTDNDNNNISDETNRGYDGFSVPTLAINIKLFNYSFIDTFQYGKNFINENERIIDINNINATTNDIILYTNDNNSIDFINDINLLNRQAIDLGRTDSLNCFLFNSEQCLFNDNGYSGVTTGDYRGIITVNGNNLIQGLWFDKNNNANNGQILSNSIDVPVSNIIIQNNTFLKQDSRNKTGDEQIISLYVNNLKLTNNEFKSGGLTSSRYELLNIKSDNPTTNDVYLNIFNSSLSDAFSSEIFSKNADAKFYNNYVDCNYNITNLVSNNLNVTPTVSFYNPDDNKVYYYRIGNYYSCFSPTCTDADSDGFCDSSYQSGTVTDTHPLSEYPFNYKNHLFTADSVVTLQDFNITILQPDQQNKVYVLSDLQNDVITLGFKHDSNFNDLTCEYILDGNTISSINNADNSEHYINVTNWNEKQYSFYVNCYNDYISKVSDVYYFNVTTSSSGGGGGTVDNETSETGDSFSGSMIDTDSINNVYSDDITTSTDSVKSFIKTYTASAVNLIVPILGFFSILLVVGIIIQLVKP